MSARTGLTAWERWELASFDETAPADGGTATPAAPNAAEDPTAPVSPAPTFSAEEILELRARARDEGYAEGRAAGYAEGLAQGLEEGRAKGEMTAVALGREQAERLIALIEALEQQLAALDDAVAPDLLDLALSVARSVIGQQLRIAPEGVAATVRQALALLPVQHANIQLHPEDLALVREHAADALAHGAHRLHENPALARGDVLLDAGGSHLDATVAGRWQRVLFSLGRGDPLIPPAAPTTEAP